MSSENATPLLPSRSVDGEPTVSEYEGRIESQLSQTQRHVKWVDVTAAAMTLAVGVLGYLLSAALIDHWLITGGLGFWGRFVLWTALVAGGAAYFVCRVWPPLVHRINPIFAAATIEKSEPSLKNSLINFLLLRRHREEVSPVVFQAVERRAASDLSRVHVDSAVDRAHIIRLGYVLVALLAIFVVYSIASPKNPLRSAARVLWPWSQIEPPTRVEIRDLKPGNAIAFHGESVAVSAEVKGVQDAEPVSFVYSTADGQCVDQMIPLTRPSGEYRYQCQFPPDKLGLQQSCQYYLVAGDARTRRFKIDVRIAPTILVDRVDYHYPGYTEMGDRSVERQGDMRAIEGTEVTIHATTNADIQAGTAEIDLGCNGRSMRKMTAQDREVAGRFTLRLQSDDPSKPEYDGYQLRFADGQGQENRRPIRHSIEVIRDLPPNVRFVEPETAEAAVAVNARLPIRLFAQDPDYALRRVTLWAEVDGKPKSLAVMLDRPSPKKPWTGEFQETAFLEPAQLGLKAGDSVQIWGEAEDNREPEPNRSVTNRCRIDVTQPDPAQAPPKDADSKKDEAGGKPDSGSRGSKSPTRAQRDDAPEQQQSPRGSSQNAADAKSSDPTQAGEQEKPAGEDQTAKPPPASNQEDGQPSSDKAGKGSSKQQSGGSESGEKSDAAQGQDSGEQSSNEGQDGQGQSGDGQDGQQKDGQSSGRPNERVDPETDPGGAIQEILKERQEQQEQEGQKSQQGQQQGQQQQDGQQSQESQQQGGEQSSGGESAENKPSEGQESSENQKPSTGEKTSKDQESANGKDPAQNKEPSTGEKTSKNQKPESGKDPAENKEPSDGEKTSEDKRPSEGKEQPDASSGEQQPGGKQPSKTPPDQQKASPEESEDKQSGDQQGGTQQGASQQDGQEGEKGEKPDEQGGQQQDAQAKGGQQGQGKNDADKKPGKEQSKSSGSKSADSSSEESADQEAGDQGGKGEKADKGKAAGKKSERPDKKAGDQQAAKEKTDAEKAGDKTAEENEGTDQHGESREPDESMLPPAKGKPSSDVKKPTTPERSDPNGPQKSGDASDAALPKSGKSATSQEQKQAEAAAGQPKSEDAQKADAKSKATDAVQKGQNQKSSAKEDGSADGAASESDAADDGKTTSDPTGDQTGEATGEPKDQATKQQQAKPSSKPGKGQEAPGEQDSAASPEGNTPPTGGDGKQEKTQDPGKSGNQSSKEPNPAGAGSPATGGSSGNQPGSAAGEPVETPPDPANLAYAEKQTELALEYLRDQLAKEKRGLLDRLGWTKEDAKRFINRWEEMEQAAKQRGQAGKDARKRLTETLQSLGLRPRGTTIGRGGTPADQQQNLRDAGRFAAPPEWAEQFRDYTRGIADPKQAKGIREKPR